MYGIFLQRYDLFLQIKQFFWKKSFFWDAGGAQTTGLVAIIGCERPINSTTGGEGSNL